jgi:hypothetical protein
MQPVQVDPIGAETPQRRLDRAAQVRRRHPVVVGNLLGLLVEVEAPPGRDRHMVYVGLVDEDDEDDEDDESRWSPADMYNETSVDLTAVADTARLLAQELTLRAELDRGRVLLCSVAAELNGHDWASVLPVTDDFVVYAVDMELVDLHRNMRDCVPADKLAHSANAACSDRTPHWTAGRGRRELRARASPAVR